MLSTFQDGANDLFRDFGIPNRPVVIAAVSGGSDSLALLLLLKAWIERRAPSTRLIAVTIDHALRREAADEAREVARLCKEWGIAHRTVRWAGEKPRTGIADAARLARYRLLADAARELGTDLILTGHTLDDQAETVAMRAARGEGRGMAGMARATRYDGRVWIVRPLLKHRRLALREFLAEAGVRWIDDPSNENEAAERVRVRKRLAAAPEKVDELIQRAEKARRERRELGAVAATHLTTGELVSPGLVRLPAAFLDARTEGAIYALRILLATAGGAPQLPDLGRARELFERLSAGPVSATLSRTLVDRRRTHLYLLREARGLPRPAMLAPGDIWDGRFRIRALAASRVGPVGAKRAAAEAPAIDAVPRGLVAGALAAEPRVEGSAPDVSVPCLERLVSPWAMFLPDFDIVPNNAVAELFGGPLTASWP